MRIFLRTFNNKINSKTGTPLPEGQYRGTPEWITFQNILIDCIKELGHRIETFNEGGINDPVYPLLGDKNILCHRTFRDEKADLYWMQLHFRELFTIDTNGWGADHSGNHLFNPQEVDQDEATRFCEEKSKNLLSSGISKCNQADTKDETPKSFILIPIQIPRDYTIKNHSPITVKYFLDSIMSWAEESKTHVCIKLHPCNKIDQDLQQALQEGLRGSNFVHKVEGNIHELIKRSSGVFVINSGTGFESLVHGKPVATFGSCDYSRATWNADIRRLDEARDFLYSYTDVERGIGYQLVFWYWMKHAYDVNDPNTPARLTEYLRSNL